jgi:hypothetical protein
MILYLKDAKNSNKNITNTFSKVAVYKINIKMSSIFIHHKQLEEKMRKTMPFTIASKLKYLRISLIKEVKGLYNEKRWISFFYTEERNQRIH